MENKVEKERARRPGNLPLILEHSEEDSLFLLLQAHIHGAQLVHEGAVAIKPAQRGAQIERETEGGLLSA